MLAGKDFLHRVQRTGAGVAIDNANGGNGKVRMVMLCLVKACPMRG
jgi:hypothetical protein